MASPVQEENALKSYTHSRRGGGFWSSWSTRRKLLVGGLVLLVVVAIAVGVGVGVGVSKKNSGGDNSDDDDNGNSSGSGSGGSNGGGVANATNPANASYWLPTNGTSWQIVLLYALNDTSPDVDVYDIDLFTNNKTTVDELHSQGRKVICYFSAGSYENFRPDKDKFLPSDLGKTLDGWPDEKWLNTNSTNVRNIMKDRLNLAVEKGCDGVDPDNIDGYDNDNGLGLTTADAANYVNFLADEAHKRNMSVGLKNGGAILEEVLPKMQWSVNEQCVQYNECDTFAAFITNGKPVFHIEYPDDAPDVQTKTKNSICDANQAQGFSTVIKEMSLNNWLVECPDDWDAETDDPDADDN